MTRRRRLRRRLLWAGVLLGLALVVAVLSVVRLGLWTGSYIAGTGRPRRTGRKGYRLHRRTAVTGVALLTALVAVAPASAHPRATPAAPDWLERFASAHSLREPVVDDRFRIGAADAAGPVTVSRRREIEWPRVGLGVAVGILLGLGLVPVVRLAEIRLPKAQEDAVPETAPAAIGAAL